MEEVGCTFLELLGSSDNEYSLTCIAYFLRSLHKLLVILKKFHLLARKEKQENKLQPQSYDTVFYTLQP